MAVATRVEPITGAVHLSIDMQNIFARWRLGDAVDGARAAIDRGDYRPLSGAHRSEQIELVKTAELPELWPEGA